MVNRAKGDNCRTRYWNDIAKKLRAKYYIDQIEAKTCRASASPRLQQPPPREHRPVLSGAPSAVWRPCAAVLRLGRGPGLGLQARASHRALRRAGEWCFCLRWSCHLLISVSLCAEPGEEELLEKTHPKVSVILALLHHPLCSHTVCLHHTAGVSHIRQQQARFHPLCVLGAASSGSPQTCIAASH